MTKVLLLNPPSKKVACRDYYCGHIAKGDYSWPPYDLLVLSGLFPKENLEVLDCIVEKKDRESVFKYLSSKKIDFIIGLFSSVTYSEDEAFYSQLSKEVDAKIYLSGDFPKAHYKKLCTSLPIKGVVLDFVENNLKEVFLDNKYTELVNIYHPEESHLLSLKNSQNFTYGIPKHELFPLNKYKLAQGIFRPLTVIGTDFSCPYSCTFCFFEKISYKKRDLQEFQEELKVINNLGIKEIMLMDASFGVNKNRALKICEMIKVYCPKISWICEMRVSDVNVELIKAMKEAGCHTIMLGIETQNQKSLDSIEKHITTEQTKNALIVCKNFSIRTLGHFILGLPGDKIQDMKETIEFSLNSSLSFASYNIATPMVNTTMRDEAEANQGLKTDIYNMNLSDGKPLWTHTVSADELYALKKQAYRRFYLRPSYIIRQLLSIRSFNQLQILVREGIYVVLKNIQVVK